MYYEICNFVVGIAEACQTANNWKLQNRNIDRYIPWLQH